MDKRKVVTLCGSVKFYNKMQENYFIIHGSFGSPFGNWFSWLQDFGVNC